MFQLERSCHQRPIFQAWSSERLRANSGLLGQFAFNTWRRYPTWSWYITALHARINLGHSTTESVAFHTELLWIVSGIPSTGAFDTSTIPMTSKLGIVN